MAFSDSTVSPIAERRFVISRRLKPASTRTRVWLVEINAEFPELLLANMQTLTMVSLLALSDFRYNTRATKWAKNVFCAQIPLRAMLVLYSPGER